MPIALLTNGQAQSAYYDGARRLKDGSWDIKSSEKSIRGRNAYSPDIAYRGHYVQLAVADASVARPFIASMAAGGTGIFPADVTQKRRVAFLFGSAAAHGWSSRHAWAAAARRLEFA